MWSEKDIISNNLMSYIYLILINRKLNWISYIELLSDDSISRNDVEIPRWQQSTCSSEKLRKWEGTFNTPSMNIINKLITRY